MSGHRKEADPSDIYIIWTLITVLWQRRHLPPNFCGWGDGGRKRPGNWPNHCQVGWHTPVLPIKVTVERPMCNMVSVANVPSFLTWFPREMHPGLWTGVLRIYPHSAPPAHPKQGWTLPPIQGNENGPCVSRCKWSWGLGNEGLG